ncbi:MAG: WxL domain-containing protein [Carnobacterium maltaromaticum]
MIKKRIPRFGLMFLTSIVILFFFNISRVQAAYDSNISINPLYANGITIKNGQLNLSFPTVGSEGTLTYVPSGSNIPFHARYANEKYVGIDIIRDEKVIFTTSVNGDTKQEVLTNALSNLKVKDTDILHFYLAEPTKEGVTNFEKETSLLADQFRGYFQKDMYYMMTYGGFIPVNNGISHLMYDENKIRTSATQMSSLFSGNILNFGYSGSKDYNFFGIVEPDTQFHTFYRGYDYYAISHYEITDGHQLGSTKITASALGETSYSDMGKQLNKLPVKDGTIYKIFSAEPRKIRLWKNGVSRQIQDKLAKETYVELTKNQGLVELDFNRVTSKAVTVELGSNPEKLNVEDFTNVSDYPNLSSSFKTNVKTDMLGTYNQDISIRQNLVTAANYFLSTVSSKVTVVDTTPPTATGKANVEIPIYESLPTNPAELLENLKDNSGIENLKTEYLDENGDTSIPGVKIVKIRLTDVSGNFSDISVPITVVPGSLAIARVPNLDFGQFKIGVATKSMNQVTSEIEIHDFRGTKEGWTLQASKSDFSTQDGKKINADITFINGIVSSLEQQINGVNTYNITLNDSPQPIMQAQKNSGMKKWVGTFKTENVYLDNISPDARVGSYESTINWTLLNAP